MSSSGVHRDEMPSSDPLADPALAPFIDDLQVVATRPVPPPSPGLAAFLDGGISPPAPVPAPSPSPARRATPRRKMTVSELLGALVAKLAGLGMAAKAALGVTLAAASVTTAGAANVLPDPAQHAVATVVNAASPLDIPDPSKVDEIVDGTDDLPEIPDVTTTIVDGDEEGDGDGGTGAFANHGACVSAVARDRSATGSGPANSHGKAVSEAARSDCGKDGAGSTTTTVPSATTTTLSPTTTTVAELGTTSNRGPANGNGNGNSGPGNGNANRGGGSGNSGAGNGNSGRR